MAFVTNDDLAERVASIAALADPIRCDLYSYVTAQPAPVSRDQASDALGIARHTAKFNLDKLAGEGLLDIDFKRLTERRGPGAGRPTKLYRRSSRQLSVTLPERRYDLAAQLLASAIDATADGTRINDTLKAAATDSGRAVGDQARAAAGPQASREQLLDCACEALSERGYAPRRTGGTIVLSNCPFDTLAREHTPTHLWHEPRHPGCSHRANPRDSAVCPARTRNKSMLCRPRCQLMSRTIGAAVASST